MTKRLLAMWDTAENAWGRVGDLWPLVVVVLFFGLLPLVLR
jgi:hypothetical protein